MARTMPARGPSRKSRIACGSRMEALPSRCSTISEDVPDARPQPHAAGAGALPRRRLRAAPQPVRCGGDRTDGDGDRDRPGDREEYLRAPRRAGGRDRARAVDRAGRRRVRRRRPLGAPRRFARKDARRRGLPLALEAHHEAAEGRRGVGLAPGLRLLVRPRLRTAASRCCAARTISAGSTTARSAPRRAPTCAASRRR